MFATIDPSVTVAVLAAAIGPLGAYLIAVRRMSGKIGNSDAEQLWAESKSIRDWSKERLEACETEIRDLREALSKLTTRFTLLEAENSRLSSELRTARARILELESV